ncbi:MAG: hypothetical protein MZV70_56715 [Desulfobacterales bacterium]|nr:hypothetical protein [Desulfobacterales bacterium]
MEKWEDNRAWFLVLPVFVVVAFSAIIPLMTVVNYSLQDIFGPGQAVFVGTEWFKQMLADTRLHDALWRQFLFSGLVLLIEIPLGILIALAMPKKGWTVSASLVTLAIPLLIPWNVIGTIWIIFTPAGHRPLRGGHQQSGHPGRAVRSHGPADLRLGHPDGHGSVALDPAGGAALLRRAAGDPRSLLPGRPHRRRLGPGRLPLHPAAQDARGAHHRGAAALHGQLPDLRRALRPDRRRPGQYHHVPFHLPGQAGHRPVRPGAGGRLLAHLFSHRPAASASYSTRRS